MNTAGGILACAALELAWGIAASADDPLSDCRGIAGDAARLACYDGLADRQAQPVKTPEPDRPPPATAATGAAAAPPAQAALPLPSPEELFGRSVVQSEDTVRRAAGVGQLEEITAKVTGVHVAPYGKLVLTLDNGQVWSQADSSRLSLNSGDDVRIRRASLGSYLLTAVGRKQAIRVRRSK